MMKKVLVSAAIVLAAAACQDQRDKQAQRDVWVTNYNVAFDVMVACLAAPPQSGFQVYAEDILVRRDGTLTLNVSLVSQEH